MSIIIDGMVGVGKSTLAAALESKGFHPYYEPAVANPFLEKFYGERQRYAFASQVFFLLNSFKFSLDAGYEPNVVIDRSIYGHAVFAKMLRLDGTLSEEEYNTYGDLHETLVRQLPPPQLLVYLDADTDTVLERIKQRGRKFEQSVEREYWEKLNAECRRYFLKEYFHSPKIVIKVDGLDLMHEGSPDLLEITQRIRQELYQ
jgi:deoxyadenosine/deoxycytidine kinase